MPRWIEIGLAVVGLVVASPLLATIALVVWLPSGGPILFRQMRVGRGGRTFQMHKFRTMSVDPGGTSLTLGEDDPRVTRAGRFLRRSKLDELPQLFNVLRGDMKLVGPRPEVPEYVELYTDRQRAILAVPPGITDPASLAFYDESRLLAASLDPERLYVEEILPRKLAMNADYLRCRTGWSDVTVLLQTLGRTFLGSIWPRFTGVSSTARPQFLTMRSK